MSRVVLALLALTVCPLACVRSAEPVSPSDPSDAYGYESSDDPLAEAQAHDAELPTSCKNVRCSPPRVCRLVSMSDPGGEPHAYCLSQDDDLCKLDRELCGVEICRTDPGVCQ